MKTYKCKRNKSEIDDVVGFSEAIVVDGLASFYPDMSYEQGVYQALLWVLGRSDNNPIEDDDLREYLAEQLEP